jgi:hypothetical protein
MNTDELIAIDLYCTHCEVEVQFVEAMQERGLIQITVVEERRFISVEHLPRLEKLARMHYDLDIDLAGIEALSHMLERMQGLQERIRSLQDRLGRYEDIEGR